MNISDVVEGKQRTLLYLATLEACALSSAGISPSLDLSCTEAMQVLVDGGADVNKRGGRAVDGEDESALELACRRGCAPAVKVLLEGRADPNTANSKAVAPLHLAAYSGSVMCVRLLLATGANVNATDRNGATPLFFATDPEVRVFEKVKPPPFYLGFQGASSPARR
jgi:ankyrin repeat protein